MLLACLFVVCFVALTFCSHITPPQVNSAQPVLLVDLPASVGGAAPDAKSVLEGAAATLAAHYPHMFKPSTACKAPHVNIDALRDRLHQTDALAAHGLAGAPALLDWLLQRNAALEQLSDAGWAQRRPARKSAAADATFAKVSPSCAARIDVVWQREGGRRLRMRRAIGAGVGQGARAPLLPRLRLAVA